VSFSVYDMHSPREDDVMLLTRPKLTIAAMLLLGSAGGGTAQEPIQKSTARLEALWADLASTDETRAVRATLGLAANSKEAVPFLKERLKPVKVDAAAVAKLVKQLDSEDFETRETAARDLEYLGKFAKAVLEKHMAETESAEAKRAIRVLIDKMPSDEKAPPPAPKIKGNSVSIRSGGGEIQIFIDGKQLDLTAYAPKPPPVPYMGWIRAARATAVLEHLASPDARQLLEKLAEGEADAPPTKAAKEALVRLKNNE
jgi:hypothetical protein